MDKPETVHVGLTTNEALDNLHHDIEQVLKHHEEILEKKKFKLILKDVFHNRSQHSTLTWPAILAILFSALSLMISYSIHPYKSSLIYEALFIMTILFINLSLVIYDSNQKIFEIPRRVQMALNEINKTKIDNPNNQKHFWGPENFPHLCSPFSPCITLQWTYRDGELVNLPWALLVRDDIVVIRAGQISPGYCEALEKNDEYPILHPKEVYGPSLKNANEAISTPKTRKPLENKMFRLIETPYLTNLKMALEQALDRPVTHSNQQRCLLMTKIMEQIAFPTIFFLIILINFVRYFYLKNVFGAGYWVEMFLIVPISVTLPLLPIIFPSFWIVLNCFGNARLRTLYENSNFIAQKKSDLFEDPDTASLNPIEPHCTWRDTWENFKRIFLGSGHIITRSANLLHVLGSVTALCCVDKKGILSWPNPTAEKVFFLRNPEKTSNSSSLDNVGDINADTDSLDARLCQSNANNYSEHAYAEVLDLTHDQMDPFKLHFDDQEWSQHINSLKPLGLAILLNTCNFNTQEHYSHFCSHITCEAMYNEHLVPVTNRRCLCELAKQIGFSDHAEEIFKLEQQLSTFRHLQPETVRRDSKFARSLQLSTKLKFPFPHMVAVIVKEISSGTHQLLSQGTADIIVDSCVDYWDGQDLCPLTPQDRKKIQDFYQRTSLTSYCTAFAYRPLNNSCNDKLSQVYLELPSDCKQLFRGNRSPTPIRWSCRTVLEPKFKGPIGQFYSTDSLLYTENSNHGQTKAENSFDIQCNQIFIGMVTMQYQAQADMVHLIEQLERACIRFVHFSKENELRSRVFSEKMGLESGWNCHISLLSERNSNLETCKALSFSAPSAINLEHSVVKFESTGGGHHHRYNSVDDSGEGCDINSSEESELMQHASATERSISPHEHWQSLSCLTDSTEQSAPVNFDMSNRAKLPRGIDKIRPHIEQIDNVPLLVSLFTDCTPSVIREMLHIMQDFGEVVCVMCSSANSDNMGICMQADVSIAVEPLYPQVCQKVPVYQQNKISPSPIELSRTLNSITCPLSVCREDPFPIYHLIMSARHYMISLWNTIQFWLCCCVSISLIQALAVLLMLPPILRTGNILWVCFFIIPILSTSLMGLATDETVMKQPLGKNQCVITGEIIVFVFWCYGAKFLPMIFMVILTFFASLASYCQDICLTSNCTCSYVFSPQFQNQTDVTWGGWSQYSYSLFSAQQLVLLVIVLHFLTISISFVNRDNNIWAKCPNNNLIWIATVVILLILHSLYTSINLIVEFKEDQLGFDHISSYVLVFAFCSPLLSFAIVEFVKHKEIKVNRRYQRRARLDFGTKLGMNSPF